MSIYSIIATYILSVTPAAWFLTPGF